jgi:nucleotide-binding universal stress UspA family protein
VRAATRARVAVEERIVSGRPHRQIVSLARACRADLIVMGSEGVDALGHALFGSTADRVIRIAPCPVLTVRG